MAKAKSLKTSNNRKTIGDSSDDFESVAKRLGCDDDKATFEKKLGKIAKATTVDKPKRGP
jgi:hypothetical protein